MENHIATDSTRYDVSVVMPVKNEGPFVEEALLSILTQTGLAFEVVFINDHSTDDTFETALALTTQFANLRVITNPFQGKVAAVNYGISLAQGRFVCLFAGDDIMPPGSLAERFDKVRDCDDSKPVSGLCKLRVMSDDPKRHGQVIPRTPGRGTYSGVCPLMNAKVVDLLFPIPDSLPNEDTWMETCLIYLPEIEIIHSDTISCDWRIHSGNSINVFEPFATYNIKIGKRMKALSVFDAKYGDRLAPAVRRELRARVKVEAFRSAGKPIALMSVAGVGLVDKLRSLSASTPFFFQLRQRFFRLLSGW